VASFDGRYQGTVQVTGSASGTKLQDCATDPQMTFDVRNSAFTYTQPHPNVAGTAPTLTVDRTTSAYKATISPAGTISGSSAVFGGTMSGRVAGSHMAGRIIGVLCYYSFVADRVG
jgi:hypothetical protein